MPHDTYKMADADGHFRRQASTFRDTVSPTHEVYQPEKGRYLLYVNLGCPWANRTLITRKLKKLDDDIDISMLQITLGPEGWFYDGKDLSEEKDPIWGHKLLKEVYHHVDPDYDLRYTIPVLFDKKTKTIVNNESSEIIRIFNSWHGASDDGTPDLYPESLRQEIDELNLWVYGTVNNGVYKTGFASTQEAYEANVWPLFKSLERLEKLLEGRDYLVGPGKGELTEADVRLYTTIARFDVAYYNFFKCNLRRIQDHPNIYRWFVSLYDRPEFKSVTNFHQIKVGYVGALKNAPAGIVPIGPESVFKDGTKIV